VQSKAAGESGGVEMVWKGQKECLLEVADEICGRTKEQGRLVKHSGGMMR